jgi:2-oxopent-4-enoate/cis-2-oxohex-4-enoate hydratase
VSEKPRAFVNPASGSIRLTGEVDFVDADGNVIESIDAPKLCGCGLSKEKPRCDGSHKEYVKLFAEQLRSARELAKPCMSFAPIAKKARDIRENELTYRLEAGETVLGVKVGGALDSANSAEPTSVMIFGYLTDAMQLTDSIKTSNYIYPRAEAEVVFKISKEISTEIHPSEVLDYVSHVATGIEIFDYRYGQAQIYANDAIADNAGAAAFVYSHWVPAYEANLENLTAQVFENDSEIETAPLTAIRGNPWLALVLLSKILVENGVKLPAGSIVFSGSATKGLHLAAGNNYAVEIKGLGRVEIKAL